MMNLMLHHAEALLPTVLSASLSAAAVVVVVQAIVWLTGTRLAPKWCHALWLVAFVRLGLPTLPEVPSEITPPKPTPKVVAEYIATLEETEPLRPLGPHLKKTALAVPPAVPQPMGPAPLATPVSVAAFEDS